MSELGDLLELLHGARQRYASVRSTWRTWRHDPRQREAFLAHAESSGATTFASWSSDGEERPPEVEGEIRFWADGRERVREERSGEPGWGSQLAIRVGDTWWSYSPDMGAMTNAGDKRHQHGLGELIKPLLDPAALIGLLDFELGQRGERLGRPLIAAIGRPRALDRQDGVDWGLHALGHGADEHRLEVDAERGVILRAEARIHGAPFSVVEATEIGFDEPLDPQLFVFTPPPGVDVRRVDLDPRVRADLSFREAAELVPFALYVVDAVPPDWDLHVGVHTGPGQPDAAPTVHLSYRTRDATSHVNVMQTTAANADPGFPDGDEIERDGRTMRVRERDASWPQAQLSITIGETFITMHSESLKAEDLVGLAAGLVRG